MTVERVQYDAGTMSAPAFLDVWLSSGSHWRARGKAARRLSAVVQEGDPIEDEDLEKSHGVWTRAGD